MVPCNSPLKLPTLHDRLFIDSWAIAALPDEGGLMKSKSQQTSYLALQVLTWHGRWWSRPKDGRHFWVHALDHANAFR